MTLDVLDRPEVVADDATSSVRAKPAKLGIIDCDCHPTVRNINEMKPYLAKRWWERIEMLGLRPRHGFMNGDPYPKAAPRAARRDAWTPEGFQPGSDLAYMREHYLDAYDIECAILSPLNPTGQGDQNPEFTNAMCTAVNDWQLDTWVHQDSRLKASIVVSYEDTPAAVAEIEKRADDPGFAQVLLLTRTSEPLGRRRYWPIYEAAERHNIPVGIHVFGYSGYPVSGTGWPSYYLEEMVGHSAACQSMVASLALEGVFERYPGLKVINIEGAFGWFPSLCWRLDKHWARMRAEVPHVKRPPSEYLRQQLWITTQPVEEPENPQHLLDLMEWVGWDRLLFATDYPHWDFDDPAKALPASLSRERREQVCSGNAKKLFPPLLMVKHVVAAAAEIPDGGSKLVEVKGRPIAIFNVKGEFFALYDKCPHEGGSLCRGKLTGLVESDEPGQYKLSRKGEIVRCSWHGWEFDLRTGKSWCDPRRVRVKNYAVSVEPGTRLVEGPYVAETFPVSVEGEYVVVEV